MHEGGGAVVEAAGVGGGDGAVLLERGLRTPETLSIVAPARMYSSSADHRVALAAGLIVTGAISSLKRPEPRAASALFCEATENASCSPRVTWYCSARFSAVMPM